MGVEKVSTRRYRGRGATEYEAKRAGTNKWKLENEGVAKLFPDGAKSVLDAAVGTGRFCDLYESKRVEFIDGIDTSPDMLAEARKKGMVNLHLGDVRDMPFDDKEFDVIVCIRLFAWFEPEAVQQALAEMARVSDVLIVNIRTNEEQSFCKSESLWNHYRPDFYKWVDDVGFKVDEIFHVGNKGNDIYRLVPK